jgi:hypothetical protein
MRDMTKKQFEVALVKNGFKRSPMSLFWFVSASEISGPSYGAVVDSKNPKKILRRATLERIIKNREQFGVTSRAAR